MPVWIRNSLFAVALVCCAIIGMRVYLIVEDQPEAPEVATGAVENGFPDKLPTFTLNDSWGEPRSIDEWAGQPLLINFWATWCAPCRREMPLLQAVHNSGNNVQVVGIAIDRVNDVQTYLAETGITYTSLVGEGDAMAVADLFGLDGLGLPFSVLVSTDGDILTIFIGEIDAAELQTMVRISQSVDRGELDLQQARQQLQAL